ncbi:hypothetical protein ACMV8I_06070 [Ewingella sp. S1.OA.A_B6]
MAFQTRVDIQQRVEIYQFSMWDIREDMPVTSSRWGTSGAIEHHRGTVLRETGVLVSASDVGPDGFTVKGYKPK